jgi:hypothetical protein
MREGGNKDVRSRKDTHWAAEAARSPGILTRTPDEAGTALRLEGCGARGDEGEAQEPAQAGRKARQHRRARAQGGHAGFRCASQATDLASGDVGLPARGWGDPGLPLDVGGAGMAVPSGTLPAVREAGSKWGSRDAAQHALLCHRPHKRRPYGKASGGHGNDSSSSKRLAGAGAAAADDTPGHVPEGCAPPGPDARGVIAACGTRGVGPLRGELTGPAVGVGLADPPLALTVAKPATSLSQLLQPATGGGLDIFFAQARGL